MCVYTVPRVCLNMHTFLNCFCIEGLEAVTPSGSEHTELPDVVSKPHLPLKEPGFFCVCFF